MQYIKNTVESYSEINQQIKCKFTVCSLKEETLTEVKTPVLCRDFFNELSCFLYTRQKMPSIYGFSSDIEHDNLVIDGHFFLTVVLCKNVSAKLYMAAVINMLEIDPFYLEKDRVCFKVPIKWMSSSAACSLLTFLLRYVFLNPKASSVEELLETSPPENYNEFMYVKQIKKENLLKLWKYREEILFKDEIDLEKETWFGAPTPNNEYINKYGIHAFHNMGGIVNVFTNKINNSKFKHRLEAIV